MPAGAGRRGEGGCTRSEFPHPGSMVGQGGRGCCCGKNPSCPLFSGGLGGVGAVGRFESIDSSAAGSQAASLDTIAAESAGAASDRAPGGLDGVDGGGVPAAAEGANVWGDGDGDASVVAASGQASTFGGGKGEVGPTGSVASSAGGAESQDGRASCRAVPSFGSGFGTGAGDS
jgi:hypothetical protein